jgi:hypothetical protein
VTAPTPQISETKPTVYRDMFWYLPGGIVQTSGGTTIPSFIDVQCAEEGAKRAITRRYRLDPTPVETTPEPVRP